MWDRDLREEELDDDALHENLRASIEESIYDIQRRLGMFKTEGWETTKKELQRELHLAMASLATRRFQKIGDIEFVRGQVHAYQQLLGREEQLRQRLARHSQELNSLEKTRDPDEPGL